MDFVGALFDTSGFPARWHCGRWSQALGWLHIVSDLAIAAAYVAIPITIAVLVLRRRDLPFHSVFWLFAAFIIACGTTHLNEAIIFWHPIYRFQGVVKLATGIVSWATVVALIPTVRRVMSLRTPEQLELEVEQRTAELRMAQEDLRSAHATLEQRVVERTRDLERSNRDLQQFAHGASHDLQEPLRMVASYTELLRDEYAGKLGPEADAYIGFASDGARRMQRLIEDLLAYSRAGHIEGDTAGCDASDALRAARANLGERLQSTGASLTAPETLPRVAPPLSLMTQVFQNLVGNALKFTKPGDIPVVTIEVERVGEMWRFAVRDRGIGFEAVHAERIFSIFRRLHHAEEYEGTGVGLALCQRIVERFGGHIWAESAPGEGATFFFELPEPTSRGEEPAAPLA